MLKGTRENQLAVTEFDRASEKRDQIGKVQGDRVPAKATPHTHNCASDWSEATERLGFCSRSAAHASDTC